MFASEIQRARVCSLLCSAARIPGMLWTDHGPTNTAIEIAERDGGGLSSGERVVFLAAWDIWAGDGKCRIDDVAYRLDRDNLTRIGSLLVAMGEGVEAIDLWLLSTVNMVQARAIREHY